eukprot:gnl/Ergobibamus_cyprinoides/1698.p1 GENE.gnl/Ergobibamus_cyprinoides/1698~~gnl/Ergobibamus_cyprinoides/1698.p1  ORF type:complete len:147 (+),score=2.14 gnl/Ergobibamus_cyprinoides/1698:224-664(+)
MAAERGLLALPVLPAKLPALGDAAGDAARGLTAAPLDRGTRGEPPLAACCRFVVAARACGLPRLAAAALDAIAQQAGPSLPLCLKLAVLAFQPRPPASSGDVAVLPSSPFPGLSRRDLLHLAALARRQYGTHWPDVWGVLQPQGPV